MSSPRKMPNLLKLVEAKLDDTTKALMLLTGEGIKVTNSVEDLSSYDGTRFKQYGSYANVCQLRFRDNFCTVRLYKNGQVKVTVKDQLKPYSETFELASSNELNHKLDSFAYKINSTI